MKNIPKKIHLIWFGPKSPNIPYLNKIEEIYHDYEIKIWREEDFNFDELNDFTKYAYEKKKWAFVSDYFRMKILFEEGGIYLDADMEPIKKFDIDSDADLFMGYEYRNNVTMGFIASVAGHAFSESVMQYYESIVNPSFFPLGNLVWTEILYSLYPKLGVSNNDKRVGDLQIMERASFGLWSPSKRSSYFIHRHSIDWIKSKTVRNMIHFSAKFAKLTPAFAENIMVIHQRRLTNLKSKKTLTKGEVTTLNIENDIKFLTSDIFNEITNHKNYVNIHLEFRNRKLKKTLLKIYNVNKVFYGKKKTAFKKDLNKWNITHVGNTNREYENFIILKFKITKFRSNIETKTNTYSRLFNSGVEGLLIN